MTVPNQYANANLTELVRVQGEQLARLTVIVEEDHKDLAALKKSTEIIAKVVAARETAEMTNDRFRAKMKEVIIPVASAFLGAIGTVVAAHFIH